jgi:hypothetical protein
LTAKVPESAYFFKQVKEIEMKKLLSYAIAAMFVAMSVNAMAAKHMAAEKGASAEKKTEKKAAKKTQKKAKSAKKEETK